MRPTLFRARDFFRADVVDVFVDVEDVRAVRVEESQTAHDSTVRFYNDAHTEFMRLHVPLPDPVAEAVVGRTLLGVCQEDDGMLYAYLRAGDQCLELRQLCNKPVRSVKFRPTPMTESPVASIKITYTSFDVTVSLVAEDGSILASASRPYDEWEEVPLQ